MSRRSFKPSPIKDTWRLRLAETYKRVSHCSSIPNDRFFYTLGGPAWSGVLDPASELAFLSRNGFDGRPFLQLHQYASAERLPEVHRLNSHLHGPTWEHGQGERCMVRWIKQGLVPAVVSFDGMAGMPKVIQALSKIGTALLEHDIRNVLVSFNVMTGWLAGDQPMMRFASDRSAYPDPNRYLASFARKDAGLRRFLGRTKQWNMEPIGKVAVRGDTYHSTNTRFRTLLFWLP